MSFVGGKLKLKGGDLPATGGVKKKKRKSSGKAEDGALVAVGDEGTDGASKSTAALTAKQMREGYELPPRSEEEDRRTEAEKRHDERVRKLEEERLRKMAAKGYRDRVKDFNEHLANLSEHHDIPKVGPG